MAHQISGEMQSCIDECLDCHRLCLETITHCLAIGGDHAAADHIGALLDCGDSCMTSAHFMLRNSPLHQDTCAACATACDACAESCEAMAADDDLMRRCAAACRRCAESCRKMSGERATA